MLISVMTPGNLWPGEELLTININHSWKPQAWRYKEMEAKLAQLPGFILLQNSLILKEILSKEIFSLVHIV